MTADGPVLVQVEGIDDPSISGFMVSTDLAPRDSAAPIVRALEPGGPFSPNGDGQVDTTTISGRFTETVAWKLRVRNAGGDVLFEKTGSGSTFQAVWDGLVNGAPVPDGTYTVSVSGVDGWANAPANATRSVVIDTHAPTLEALTPGADTTQWFAPNGDGFRDTVSVAAKNERAREPDRPRPTTPARALIKKWTVENGDAAETLTWNGPNDGRRRCPRRALHDPGRPAGRGRQYRRGRRSQRQAGRRTALGRLEQDHLLPAGQRLAVEGDDAVVRARAADDRHLDDPQCRRAGRRHAPRGCAASGRFPVVGLLRQDERTARCSRAAATPRS